MRIRIAIASVVALAFLWLGAGAGEKSLHVSATAYNSHASQTEGDPRETAWGDSLHPGMRAIAVSRDLEEQGLAHGTEVQIEGLEGVWTVRDRMAGHWKNKIDIYMGNDLKAAKSWGKRKVRISWTPK